MVDDVSRAKTFLTMGVEVLGESAVAGAIGFVFGGPIGATAAATTPLVAAPVKRIVGELAGRLLSHREKRRVASAAFLAASQIKARLDRGDALRRDAFFDPDGASVINCCYATRGVGVSSTMTKKSIVRT